MFPISCIGLIDKNLERKLLGRDRITKAAPAHGNKAAKPGNLTCSIIKKEEAISAKPQIGNKRAQELRFCFLSIKTAIDPTPNSKNLD